jgi:DNA-binding NtrC family response regulator
MTKRLLLVDDDPGIRLGVRTYLESCAYAVDEAGDCAGALARLKAETPDIVLLDYKLPDGDALGLLRTLKAQGVDVPVVVLTGHGSISLAVEAMKEGAEHFLTKPIEMGSLAVVIERVLEHRLNTRRVDAARPRQGHREIDLFAGRSRTIEALARDARSVAACDAPVLIEGETGTGKGVLARWIHEASPRTQEAFVDLNCAGLPRDLLESELFGHERGAFTGAVGVKRGLIEAAHRGTMFLDEIGDTDLAVQPKLLKIVEEKRFRRLGDVSERRVDVRFIAATNASLAELTERGQFREDLYYRINTMVLRLPPLRARREDIPVIAGRLLEQLAYEMRRPVPELDPDAEAALVEHAWPGNVRELRNVLERAVLLGASPVVRRADLRLNGAASKTPAAQDAETLKDLEWQHIQRVLAEEGGSVPRAARRLGVPRSTMYQKLKLRESGGGA